MKNYTVNTRFSLLDIRDILYAPKIIPSQFAQAVDLMPNVEEVEDQLDVGSCVANGALSQCEWLAKSHGHSVDLSRMFAYTVCKHFEGRLLEDGLGTRDIYKTLRRYGVMAESLYPYKPALQYTRPPASMYAAADMYVQRYEAVIRPGSTSWLGGETADKITVIKACLNEGFPVGIAFEVTESIRTMSGPWREQDYVCMSRLPGGLPIGGHFMTIIGYDDAAQKFLIQNSWGKDWGDGGFGGFPYSIVDEAFCEAWMIRTFNNWGLREPSGIYFEEVTRFWISARIQPTEEELGTTTNVWVGARLPDPTKIDGYGPLLAQRADKTWVPASVEIPVFKQLLLTEQALLYPVEVPSGLHPYSGARVYMAYGNSPADWKTKLLCTIPTY
jgi:hypothetical protein